MADPKPPSINLRPRQTNPWIIALIWLLLLGQGGLCLTYLLFPEVFTLKPKPNLVKPPPPPQAKLSQSQPQAKIPRTDSKPKPPVAAQPAPALTAQPTLASDLAQQVRQGNLTPAEAQLLEQGRQSPLRRSSAPTTQPLPPRTSEPLPISAPPERMPPRADWLINPDCRNTLLLGTIRNTGNRTVKNVSVTGYYMQNGAEYVRIGSSLLQPSILAPNEEGSVSFTTAGPCTAGTKLEVTDFKFVE